jgi:hypothetical protein
VANPSSESTRILTLSAPNGLARAWLIARPAGAEARRVVTPEASVAGAAPRLLTRPTAAPDAARSSAEEKPDASGTPAPQYAAPPDVKPPAIAQVVVDGRTWTPAAEASGGPCRVSAASHVGPTTASLDKDNEDLAFASFAGASGDWAVVGVCDGVSNSPWGARGAQLAARAFLEAALSAIEEHGGEEADAGALIDVIGPHFHRRILDYHTRDGDEMLVAGRFIPPGWREDIYLRMQLDGPDASANRDKWYQTTLLGVVAGPGGAAVLALGDGLLSVERLSRDGASSRGVRDLDNGATGPELRVQRYFPEAWARKGWTRVAFRDADALRITVATDGVSKSPRHGFEDGLVASLVSTNADCRAYLEALAARPPGEVESDNLSIASVLIRRQA